MGLTNFEGFENYTSLANVSPVLNMPYSNGLVPTLTNSAIINSQNITTKDNISSSHKFLRITTNFYSPQINVPFRKNIEHGIVGFSFFPILPSGGKYGEVGDEYGYSPIAFLTNEAYKPNLAICVNSSGQVYLSKYVGADILYSDSSYNTKDWNISHGPHFSTPARERNPFYFSQIYGEQGAQYLNSTPNPSVYTVLPYVANTKNTNNRLYFGYWNYIEIEFDLRNNKEEFKIRINRNETSRKLDGISTYSVGIGAPLSGISNFTGSGTLTNIGTRTNNSQPASFRVSNAGTLVIVASGTIGDDGWGSTYLRNNGVFIDHSYNGRLSVLSGDIISFGFEGAGSYNAGAFTAYFENTISPRHRYASNIAFGQNRFLGVQSTSGWNTLIDDVYIIDCEDGLSPSGFLGPIACRKTNFNTTITNTAGSGTLAQASETFAGTTSLLDSIIFDRLDQSGVFRNTSFSSSESGIKEEVIAIQNTTYGFSINSNDYVEYSVLQQGSGLPLRSGVLGTNRIDGGLLFSPIYTTLPNGVALSGLVSDSGIQELQYLFIAKSNEEE
jgi:hypothetical protein